jgi:hypothetical protein
LKAGSPSVQSPPLIVQSQTAGNQPEQAKPYVTISSKPSKTEKNSHAEQIKQINKLAAQGKVPGADFISGKTLIDKVHQLWGQPDKPIQAGDPYESYSLGAGKGTYAVAVGRGDVIYDIRTFGPTMDPAQSFQQITFVEIKNTLGHPTAVRKNKTDDILVYKRGNYELKFVGPHATGHLNHISVYSPKAAKPMGAN